MRKYIGNILFLFHHADEKERVGALKTGHIFIVLEENGGVKVILNLTTMTIGMRRIHRASLYSFSKKYHE